MSDEVVLAEYDPRWPELFEAEAARLRAALGDTLGVRVEHFGSTAVPGLSAKPIIDLMVGVTSLSAARAEAVPALEAMGYEFWYDNPVLDRLFFVKGLPPNGPRTHHVHIVEPDAAGVWGDRLLFRDALRTHPEEARRYETLKRELAAQFPGDREAYTDAKGEFVRDVTARARREQGEHG